MISRSLFLAGIFAALPATAGATILLAENFDGGSVNSVFNYTNSTGAAPSTQNVGGANGNVARLTNLNDSNNNSIAWNSVAISPTPALRLSFDFNLTDDAANASAGGCCGEAADGLGIGFFPNAVYGATGGVNPSAGPVAFAWENPVAAGVPFFAVGLDIFEANNASINWNGAVLGSAALINPLNDNAWHRAVVTLTDIGTNSLVDLTIDGVPVHTGLLATGIDLDGVGGNFRLIAGGRTGGAFAQGQFDNIVVEAIPEPSLSALMALAGLTGLATRRRKA